MENKPSQFISKDGIKLSIQTWTINEPVAELILIHGVTEYAGRYNWVAKILNENKINVHSFDLRGHGNSGGERANITTFDEYIDDVHLFIENLKLSNDKIFILGHSLGGLIAMTYLIKYPDTKCRGVILSGPPLKLGDGFSPLLIKIISVLSALFPKLKTAKLKVQHISRDPKVIEDFVNDPLIYHEGLKARYGGEFVRSMIEIRKHYSSFNFPVLIMHGSADKLADPQGSQWMYGEISSEDKTLEILDGLYHEILNEPEKNEVIGKIIEWIKKRI
jgi:alpha-beta hydrolase superfamily lysophospholipase